MAQYQSIANAMHVRAIDFDIKEYIFVLQVVMGEDIGIAYANTYDTAEFKRVIDNEDEEQYLSRMRTKGEVQIEQQSCQHLKELIEEDYQSEIQAKASTLKDYKFTGADVQKLLNNLLHDRSTDLSEASIRDVLALIKSMYDSGALDSGENWSKHFISIPTKYNALCPKCNRELHAVDGLDIRCPNCGQVFKWVEEERRFYPSFEKL